MSRIAMTMPVAFSQRYAFWHLVCTTGLGIDENIAPIKEKRQRCDIISLPCSTNGARTAAFVGWGRHRITIGSGSQFPTAQGQEMYGGSKPALKHSWSGRASSLSEAGGPCLMTLEFCVSPFVLKEGPIGGSR